MVHVECMTFNHAPFVIDAMKGIAKQKTVFPFICTVIDDASTDSEGQVIKYYVQNYLLLNAKDSYKEETDDYILFFARHKDNQNCFFAVFLLKYNHYSIQKDKQPYMALWRSQSKYTAFCEGDDYWIDENKLQKQVDILENNPESVLCYTGFEAVTEKGEKTSNRYRPLVCHTGYVYDELLKTNFVQTVTVMCKADAWVKANELIRLRNTKYDYALFLELAMMGKFEYINAVTSAYRICQESASHSKSVLKEIKFASEIYHINHVYKSLKSKKTNVISYYFGKAKLSTIVFLKHYLRSFVGFRY